MENCPSLPVFLSYTVFYIGTIMEFEDILSTHSDQVAAIARILRNKLLSLDSDIMETIYAGEAGHEAVYSIGAINNPVAAIQPQKAFCALHLYYFDQVPTYPLSLEGKGKRTRHLHFIQPEDIPRADLKRVLHEIVRVAKGK